MAIDTLNLNLASLRPEEHTDEEVFHVYHVKYSSTGISERERALVAKLLEELKVFAGASTTAAEFAFPAHISPHQWKQRVQKHWYSWRWRSGMAFRQEIAQKPAKPSPHMKYLNSLMKTFPEQIGKMRNMIKASEGPRADVTQYLSKTPDFERLFKGRTWISPTESLVGSGGFAMFCVDDLEQFFADAFTVADQAENPFVSGSAFVIPIFTGNSFANAPRETLRSWFSLFRVYAIEYGYSDGLWIASREDASAVLARFYAEFEVSA